MKLPRPDLTTLVLAGLCIIAITVLALFHVPIPDVLTFLAMGSLAGGVGIAAPASSTDTATSNRIAAALARVEALGVDRSPKLPPAPRPAPTAAPAPAGAGA